jgi:hypothetical protein
VLFRSVSDSFSRGRVKAYTPIPPTETKAPITPAATSFDIKVEGGGGPPDDAGEDAGDSAAIFRDRASNASDGMIDFLPLVELSRLANVNKDKQRIFDIAIRFISAKEIYFSTTNFDLNYVHV